MQCFKCLKVIKRLTKFRPKKTKFCQCNAGYPAKYYLERLKINVPAIYPWTNPDKCFNKRDSGLIRGAVRLCSKRHSMTFYVRRHIAGMEVTRLT